MTTIKHMTAQTFLNWFVPAALTMIIGLGFMIFGRLGNVETSLSEIDARVIAIENSRFTTQDGLEMWRAIDARVTREELNGRLTRIEDILEVIRQEIAR